MCDRAVTAPRELATAAAYTHHSLPRLLPPCGQRPSLIWLFLSFCGKFVSFALTVIDWDCTNKDIGCNVGDSCALEDDLQG